MESHIWNVILTVGQLLVVGVAILLYDRLRDVEMEHQSLAKDLKEMQVLVAGNFITKSDLESRLSERKREFEREFAELRQMLRDIDAKLDTKISRAECPIIHDSRSAK